MKLAKSYLNGYKTLWEKEKLLIRSNFSFSHSVFKRLVLQTCKNQGLFGKGLYRYHGGHCTYPCFPGVLLTSTLHTILFPNHWLFSHITIVKITDSCEREMNPVPTAIINPQKEYFPSWGSNQRPPVLKSATLPTELCHSAFIKANILTKFHELMTENVASRVYTR